MIIWRVADAGSTPPLSAARGGAARPAADYDDDTRPDEENDVLGASGVDMAREERLLRQSNAQGQGGAGPSAGGEFQEEYLLNDGPLFQRVAKLMRQSGVEAAKAGEVYVFLCRALDTRLKAIVSQMMRFHKQRGDPSKSMPGFEKGRHVSSELGALAKRERLATEQKRREMQSKLMALPESRSAAFPAQEVRPGPW